MSDKFCVDCKHSQTSPTHVFVCWSPYLPKDPVDGSQNFAVCREQRDPKSLNPWRYCGHEANWFEPKETAKEESK